MKPTAEELKRELGKTHMMICECNSFEHQAILWYDKEDNELYIEIHLTTHRNFFKRLRYGLRYALGYTSRFGAWDEFLMKPEDRKMLFKWIKLTEQ
jgi:hypothetical protein